MKVIVSCGQKFHSDYMSDQLFRRGLLGQTITAHPPSRYLDRVNIPRSIVTFIPPVFLPELAMRKVAGGYWSTLQDMLSVRGILAYDRLATRRMSTADVFIGWSRSSLRQIRKIKQRGGIAMVEQCGSFSRFQNEILAEERWRLGLHGDRLTPEILVERELAEFEEADFVLCPSGHVARSLETHGIASEKLIVNPYGANLTRFRPVERRNDVFRVLFVGTIGARKGVLYLLQAIERLKKDRNIECVLIGSIEDGFEAVLASYRPLFRHIERVPNSELNIEYSNASVFAFPSLDEGMALVQLEAMACGLPVICTTNSGGDSLVVDGESGYIVPIRDPDALADRIARLHDDPELRLAMRENALARIAEFSWDRYGDRLAEHLRMAVAAHSGLPRPPEEE